MTSLIDWVVSGDVRLDVMQPSESTVVVLTRKFDYSEAMLKCFWVVEYCSQKEKVHDSSRNSFFQVIGPEPESVCKYIEFFSINFISNQPL